MVKGKFAPSYQLFLIMKTFPFRTIVSCLILLMPFLSNAQWTHTGTSTYLSNPADNVGIGTSTPAYRFDVKGDNNTVMRLQSTVNGNATLIVARAKSAGQSLINFKTGNTSIWMTGCISSNDFRLRDGSGSDAMVIKDGSRNIGIGTASPTQRLEVNGTVYSASGGFKFPDGSLQASAGANTSLSNISSTAVNASLVPGVTNTLNLGSSSLRWGSCYASYFSAKGTSQEMGVFDGGNGTYIRIRENGATRGYFGSVYGNAEDVDIGTTSGNITGGIHLVLQGAMPQLTIAPYGEIGIGTTLPAARLHIAHNSSVTDPQIMLEQTNNDFARLSFSNSSAANFWTIAGQCSTANNLSRLNFYNSVSGDVMSLTGDGNVCIGTGTPATGYKLSVNGKIICEELKVQLHSAWPDFVFGKDYKLASLEELDAFTKKNGHLPGIRSAAEIGSEGGMEVGELQAALLLKIEELTLHLIRQQKEIDLLKCRAGIYDSNGK